MAEDEGEDDDEVEEEPRTLRPSELFKDGPPEPMVCPGTPRPGSYWRLSMSNTRDIFVIDFVDNLLN